MDYHDHDDRMDYEEEWHDDHGEWDEDDEMEMSAEGSSWVVFTGTVAAISVFATLA